MAIDEDTILAPDAIEKLAEAFTDEGVVAASGMVLPGNVRTIWERGRYIEHLFAFNFYKQVQDYYEKLLISSGGFSIYRSSILKGCGGWPSRTMAEDMDLTWTFYEAGHKVRFVPEAVCYQIEPHNYDYMSRQLRRWFHGFVQNVRVHWRDMLRVPFLRTAFAVRVDAGTNPATGALSEAKLIGTAQVRARDTAPGNKGRFDVQFQRTLLDSTPLLVENQIILNELRIRPEISVTRQLRFRGVGEKNTRSIAGCGVGWGITPAVEVNANYAQIRYTHPSRAGYFAPDKIHAMDFGTYIEFEGDATLVALDFGTGA